MKEIKIKMELESGNWDISVYEIGNTYQIFAKNGDKVVHFMIQKHSYLESLKEKQGGAKVDENRGLSCKGREFLSQNDFEKMRDLLYKHMDDDLSEEKFYYGIKPAEKE